MVTSNQFDPYHEWLGIAPHERPIDHYRLLGVERFESDRQLINRMADERMMHVRQFQVGPRVQHTQTLLNELSAAKLCLLDPHTKATYDAVLQSQATAVWTHSRILEPPVAAPPVAATGVPVATIAPPPIAKPIAATYAPDEYDESNATRSLYTRLWFPVAALLGIALIAGIVWGIGKSFAKPEPAPREHSPQPANDLPPVDVATTSNDQTTDDTAADKVVVIQQEATGGINFPMSVATVHTANPQGTLSNANGTVSGWSSTDDWLSWDFNVIKPGFFKVRVTYAAGPESAGGKFELMIDSTSKSVDVRTTEDGSYVTDEIFLAVKKKGRQQLEMRAIEIPGAELLKLKSIEFSAK